ncbi:conjugal transfer protein (plasmid) [Roseobacter denitrificans]|uniref:Putative conjugal transfer protein n=1 Tax=Roseobacter denitrificans (strain ATCC 33942 / OCh 114) TaxID=375451 RepID=Q07GT4_ROSDO|nr:type IV secretion system protein [Roseobacter denitrificans]ABI93315.1 putative conjugal transfer protein [Roseobacter denitrificans OCh 114]AVL51221.1 conjugal transfer protein [Roseobacter denitrificans]SFG40579.1 type IV secretion system protein VirB6 [Roseobacter denitrificans OCh 114]
MATFISDALNAIDGTILNYAETVFGAFAGPLTGALQAMGLAGLAFVGFNTLTSFYPIRVSEYLKWGVRYVIILSVATTWAQFAPIFDIITNVPSNIGATLLAQTGAINLNVAMDNMVTNIFDVSDDVTRRGGTFNFGMALTAAILTILGAVMACVAIIVAAVGKIGLAMAVSLAPVFIASLLFRSTSDLFTTWTRFTLGFAMIPLALSGIMGAIIGVGTAWMVGPAGVTRLADVAGFLIVVLAGVIMMSQIPTIVNSLAGGIVATANGIREAQNAGQVVRTGARATEPRARQVASAVGAGRAAEGGAMARVRAAYEDSRATSAAMRLNKEKFRARSARLGRQTGMGERWEAGRAGLSQASREQAASRKKINIRLQDEPPATNHVGTKKTD